MRVKIEDLTGPALDWAVATIEDYSNLRMGGFSYVLIMDPPNAAYGAVEFSDLDYSADWSLAGPIIEREHISITPNVLFAAKEIAWVAYFRALDGSLKYGANGPTPLIAAMRCYVASRMEEEVDVPEELR